MSGSHVEHSPGTENPQAGFRAAARQAFREASTSFKPWWWRTLLGTVAVHVLVSLYLFFADPSFMTLVGVPLIAVWGALLGALIGLFGGAYAVIVRLSGMTALAPLLLVPLCMAIAWWLGAGWINESWEAVGDYLRSVGSGPGFAGARVGHPIILIIMLPLLLLFALPLAVLVAWALFFTGAVLWLGFMAGLFASLPPVVAGVVWRSGRFVARILKEKASVTP